MWQFFVSKFSELIQISYHLTDIAGLANYGLAIILMTVLIKVVLYPLTNTQLKSMRTMQELQPRLKALQAQYKDNPEKMQAETMKLYKDKGFNPLGGCLPLIVQMPILIAFYSALIKFEYKVPAHAAFLWIPNLSLTDPYYLLPVLAALTTFYQQKISAVDSSDPTQRTMMMVMPLFIGWMATKFAAGLALYWVMFNVLSILQQLYINQKNRPAVVVPGEAIIEVEAGLVKDDSLEEAELVPVNKGDKGGKADANRRKKGKSIDEAVRLALIELGAVIEDVDVEILEEPARGILGFIGTKQALVRVHVKDQPDKLAEQKLKILLDGMKIDYEIDTIQMQDGIVRINIIGKDMGLLIGRKGETLNAVQFILGLIVNRQVEEKIRVILDVEDYRLRKEDTLRSLAVSLSDKVKKTRRSVLMRPMSPHERRIIHTALQGDPEIVTFSQGEEPNRKVVIALKK